MFKNMKHDNVTVYSVCTLSYSWAHRYASYVLEKEAMVVLVENMKGVGYEEANEICQKTEQATHGALFTTMMS